VKQPYAIAMKDRSPFGLAGLWENWKNPATGEWVRTFWVITTRTVSRAAQSVCPATWEAYSFKSIQEHRYRRFPLRCEAPRRLICTSVA